MADTTTIEVKTTTYERLLELKRRGESFDAVIKRLLDEKKVSTS